MPQSDFEELRTLLGISDDSGDNELVEAFAGALKKAREKLESAEGRVHKLRAEKAVQQLEDFESAVNQLRVQVGVGPLLDRIRQYLEREQFPSAQVFLKKCLEFRENLTDENLVLEIDALQAEIEEGLRRQPIVVPALDEIPPGMDRWERFYNELARELEALDGYSDKAEYLSHLQSLKAGIERANWVEASEEAGQIRHFLESRDLEWKPEVPEAVHFPRWEIRDPEMRIWNAYLEAVLGPLEKERERLSADFLQHQQHLVSLILNLQEPLNTGDWEDVQEGAEAIQHWMEDYPPGGWEPLPSMPEPLRLTELTSMSSDWLDWTQFYREFCQQVSESESLETRACGISCLSQLAAIIRGRNAGELEAFQEALAQQFPPGEGWPESPAIPCLPEKVENPLPDVVIEEEPPPLPPPAPPSAKSPLEGETEIYPLPPPQEKITPMDALTLEVGGRRLHVLAKTRTQFGRDGNSCDVLLRVDHPDPEDSKLVAANRRLSRKHFFIEPIPGAVALVDGTLDENNQRKASAAGTFLEGEAVDVERLGPGPACLLTVGQKDAAPEVPHWQVEVLETGVNPGLHPALFPLLKFWQEKDEVGKERMQAAGLRMKRMDLVAEDLLLLWTARPLGSVSPELDSLWLLHYGGGFCFFDSGGVQFHLLEAVASGSLETSYPLSVVSTNSLSFQDPTKRLNA